jgi:hypothetical protein
MARQRARCVVLIPVGPRSDPTFANDTIASVFSQMSDVAVVVADNTRDGLDPFASRQPWPIEYVRFPSTGRSTTLGQLYVNLTRCFDRILDTYDFEVLLRLDDDALVIGPDPDADAVSYFASHPHVGCLGSFRYTCTGYARSFARPAQTLHHELSSIAALRHPRRWMALRGLYALARRHGYEDGEHCLGAACFFSHAALTAMRAKGLFANPALATTSLGDDHIYGLLVRAAGFEIDDFATGPHPLGVALRGLPMSPGELIGSGKKIVHSLKDHDGKSQADLRGEFRRLVRERDTTHKPA